MSKKSNFHPCLLTGYGNKVIFRLADFLLRLKNKKNKVKFFQNQALFANPQKLLTMEAPPFRYFCVT